MDTDNTSHIPKSALPGAAIDLILSLDGITGWHLSLEVSDDGSMESYLIIREDARKEASQVPVYQEAEQAFLKLDGNLIED